MPTSAGGSASFDSWVADMNAKYARAERDSERREQIPEAGIDYTLPETGLSSLASPRLASPRLASQWLKIMGVADYLREAERLVVGGD